MGNVFLVGAGPGDPELLTVKALRILQRADVVLYDSLVSAEVLTLIPPGAHLVDVGKRAGQKLLTQDEINALLVDYAAKSETVVRLKGGDPMLFGRASEEIESLRLAKVPFEIIPGISAAFGAAAVAGFSLTDRRAASQVLFTTFSRGDSAKSLGWREVTSDTTLAIYMPGTDYAEVATRLLDVGLSAEIPCAVISHASLPGQGIRWSNIGALFEEQRLPAPAILIVGRVATQDIRAIGEKVSAVSLSKSESADRVPQSWIKN
ncbi:MAG: uroporphyrinogen-III C-methyltransferase [Acidobacteria bacterium]|nr:uroporphyrinogen-III C-methyltransferase [Acidobacteriota bacterium]MBS1867256.1 uroporphyrinogen-III C-methyltransferase [Acidobacteriota bacterium]